MSDKVSIYSWKEVDRDELETFLDDNGRVFQRLIYLSSYDKPIEGYVAIINGGLAGAFLYFHFTKHKVNGIHIPPYAHIFGPVIAKQHLGNADVWEGLLFAASNGNLLDLKIPLDGEDILPFVNIGGRCMAIQTHIVSETKNYTINSIHSSKRRYLKKLLKLLESGELKVVTGKECLEDVLELQRLTAEKSSFSSHQETLKKIVYGLQESEFFSLVVYDKYGLAISGAFCPYDSEYAYHIINASINHEDSLLNRSNVLLTFLAVQEAGRRGLKFDFEGSSIPGVAEFYRQMGGAPRIFQRIQFAGNWKARLYFASQILKE